MSNPDDGTREDPFAPIHPAAHVRPAPIGLIPREQLMSQWSSVIADTDVQDALRQYGGALVAGQSELTAMARVLESYSRERYHHILMQIVRDIDLKPDELLANAVDLIRQSVAEEKKILELVEDEIRRRMELKDRKLAVWGDYEIALESSNESVWNAEELETTLQDLVDDGILRAGELTEIIDRTPTVRRREADRVAKRLSGQPRAAVEACRVWRVKGGRARVRVTKSVELVPEETQR